MRKAAKELFEEKMRKLNEVYEILTKSQTVKDSNANSSGYSAKDEKIEDEYVSKVQAEYFRRKESELFQKTFETFRINKGFEVYSQQKTDDAGPLGQVLDILEDEPINPFEPLREKKEIKNVKENKEEKKIAPTPKNDIINWKIVITYLLIVYAFSLISAGSLWLFGEKENTENYLILKGLFLFSPILSVIIVSSVFPGKLRLPSLSAGTAVNYLFCWFIVAGFIILSFVFTALLGYGKLDMNLEVLYGHLMQDYTPQRQFFAFFILANTFCLAFSTFLAIGSEYGWHGFLLTHLEALGRKKAALLSSFFYGLWYIPLIFVGEFCGGHSIFWVPWTGENPWYQQTGLYYKDNIFMAIAVKISFCLLFGFLLSWIYFTFKSIFFTSFAFAVFEQLTPLGYIPLRDVNIVIGGPEGLAGIFILLIIFFILYFAVKWDKFGLTFNTRNLFPYKSNKNI